MLEVAFSFLLLFGVIQTVSSSTTDVIPTVDVAINPSMKRSSYDGWSEWSGWSVCSRSCNGGVTYQLRRCSSKSGCGGESIQYKICNMQPCEDQSEFRETQCSAYNTTPYRGRLYTWLPFYDPEDPCSLTCQARSYNFVAKLGSRVQDGTRCREGSLDMCVRGKCMPVGCDLKLDSSKRVDQCGVCGGDGSTCRKPIYSWSESQYSPCSVTCGGGYQMSRPLCKNKATSKEVDEGYCNVSHRPRPKIRECNLHKCPATWVTEAWSECSATCGNGRQTRYVYCAQGGVNGTRISVSSNYCPPLKPATERVCNKKDCPRWYEGPWSGCSTTCGQGFQIRTVICKSGGSEDSHSCDNSIMPPRRQQCSTGIACADELGARPAEVESCYGKPCGPDHVNNIPDTSSIQLTYSWRTAGSTPCSASCLGGTRETIIQCIRDHDYAVVSPRMCDLDTKPPVQSDACNQHPCPPRWNTTEYTPCSKTCGGGSQIRNVSCVHEAARGPAGIVTVANNLCPQPPPRAEQFCNVFDCPPKWHLEPWSKCSKSCGGGVQIRKIKCQKEMAFGQTLELSPSDCPTKRPRTTKACNKKSCEDFILEETTSDPSTKPMFIQEKPSRKVLLDAVGTAVVYQDTIVKLRCPGVTIPTIPVVWYKNGKRLEPIGKYSVSPRGALKVRKITEDDAAVYTCVAGKVKSDINITVKPTLPPYGSSEEGRTVERPVVTAAPPRSGGDYSHEPSRQQSYLQIHPPVGEQSSSSRIADHDTWEYKHGHDIISDQTGQMPVVVASESSIGYGRGRLPKDLPHLHRLLSNLRQQQSEDPQRASLRKGYATGMNAERENYDSLEFSWMVTDWTHCSKSCGGGGFQVRASQCLVRLHNFSKTVDNYLCTSNGIRAPLTIQRCGMEECPHWYAGPWSDCNEANCFSWNTALQKRDIYCKSSNNTTVNPKFCDERMRPRRKRECRNEKCKGTWKVGEWSQCTVTCGHHGFQTRVLQCVWHGTDKPAGNSCQDLARPTVIIPCDRPPCPHNDLCVDRTTYCDVVKKMNVCHLASYRQLCCYTCRNA